MQHNIQSALNKRRDSGRSSGSHSHSPTAMLEKMQERLHNIAQDMYILNSSLARARKAAPKKRRGARRRNRVRPVKQACSETIEELISSTDAVTTTAPLTDTSRRELPQGFPILHQTGRPHKDHLAELSACAVSMVS